MISKGHQGAQTQGRSQTAACRNQCPGVSDGQLKAPWLPAGAQGRGALSRQLRPDCRPRAQPGARDLFLVPSTAVALRARGTAPLCGRTLDVQRGRCMRGTTTPCCPCSSALSRVECTTSTEKSAGGAARRAESGRGAVRRWSTAVHTCVPQAKHKPLRVVVRSQSAIRQ